jgi:RNA polymerase sigma-70 factor (ECF subfamily)
MIFRLTTPREPDTIDVVEAMPDPSRPVAPEVAALLERARRSDAAACRELFQRHVAGVHRVVRRIAGATGDVDDLVQTTFVEAFRSLPLFRGDALFSTWLTRIAVRVSLRAGRRRMPRALSLDEVMEPVADLPGPERVTAAREALAVVETLLAELRPKRRAAFALHVLEGYSMEEAAAILNASVAAVKVRIHDARRHIEKRLKRTPELLAGLRAEEVGS